MQTDQNENRAVAPKEEHEGRTAAQVTIRQAKLVAALLANPDVQTAAQVAGVGCSTAHRWLKQPAFQDEMARRRDDLMRESLASVKRHAGRAVDGLAALLDTTDDRLRRLVCNDILHHALQVHELQELERRLATLEARLKNQQKGARQ